MRLSLFLWARGFSDISGWLDPWPLTAAGDDSWVPDLYDEDEGKFILIARDNVEDLTVHHLMLLKMRGWKKRCRACDGA
jgi:hypothetical protein